VTAAHSTAERGAESAFGLPDNGIVQLESVIVAATELLPCDELCRHLFNPQLSVISS
jgi:hypothetical protein